MWQEPYLTEAVVKDNVRLDAFWVWYQAKQEREKEERARQERRVKGGMPRGKGSKTVVFEEE